MKKTISVLIAILMALSLVTLAHAETLLKGDLDRDGKVFAKEARTILRMSASLEPKPEAGSVDFRIADVDDDGRIFAKDARSALRMSASLDPKVTFETGDIPGTDEPVERLSDWQTTCIVRDTEEGAFDLRRDDAPDWAGQHRLAITTGSSEIAPAFSVVVLLDTFTEPGESMNGTRSYPAEVVARYLNKYLLRVQIGFDGLSAWLLCQTEMDTNDTIGSVKLLGQYDSCDLIGHTILLYNQDHSDGEADTLSDKYGWTGNLMGCPRFTFHRVLGDTVVMIRNHEEAEDGSYANEILVYPIELFEEHILTGEERESVTHRIGDLEARFAEETGDALILTARDGRSVNTTVSEFPALIGDNLTVTGKVRETTAGGAYSVTLPDFWAGKYAVEKSGSEMTFRHKASDTLLFSLDVHPMPEEIDKEWTGGDTSIPLCILAAENTPYNISMFDPGEIYEGGEYALEIKQMRMALLCFDQYYMPWQIRAESEDIEIMQFDYIVELSGNYAGNGDVSGHAYRLELDGGIRSDLRARLYDDTTGEEFGCTFRMFWVQGVMIDGPIDETGAAYLFNHQDGTLVLNFRGEDITLTGTI